MQCTKGIEVILLAFITHGIIHGHKGKIDEVVMKISVQSTVACSYNIAVSNELSNCLAEPCMVYPIVPRLVCNCTHCAGAGACIKTLLGRCRCVF